MPVAWSRAVSGGAQTPSLLAEFAPRAKQASALSMGRALAAVCGASLEAVLEMAGRTARGCLDADARARSAALGAWSILPSCYHG